MQGHFDHIIFVEMIVAVGHEYLQGFFDRCESILKPGGNLVFQVITLPDLEYDRYRKNCDSIQKFISPGACVPSFQILKQKACNKSGFKMESAEDIRLHYAETLKVWRETFIKNWTKIKGFGCGEYFYNMWNCYMHYYEAGFCNRYLRTYQLKFAKEPV